ncbi:NAD-dependent epimerase/dehydratase family protein [Culicoidibacter larvae]|uniref:NAD-dependent epimerase/dehydratase family protein n=1 Tax=Culicoidibacter larvae TaxID=2579976 RepID=A0A5R8QCG7_9FIRM|nr:NAD-dependent epimerase/dehydratase family protein [Culicoidibacter larvae]TLG74198.1 NAD-dependent epimerase/dehydratase family protein [Culicoidibacter larvae]
MDKTVLLTGGAGFIGSHIAENYIAMGLKVVILDDLSSGTLNNLQTIINHENLDFYQGSILDRNLLQTIFNKHKISIINNHAAQKSVPASVADPIKDNELNVVGLLYLLEMVKEHPVERFIQASTGGALAKEIIGDERSKETDTPMITSPYALTKFAVEHYLSIYGELYGFDYALLRYANVYGPRQIADGECGVVPIFADNILAGRTSKLMTYADMPRGCTRDYIYVGDAAELNQLLIEQPQLQSGIYNVGSGIELAMMDIYEALEKAFDKEVAIEIAPPRAGDLRRSILDSSHLLATFNWQPHTSLEDGLMQLKQYYDEN